MPEQIKYDPVTGKPIHEDSYTQPGNKLDQLYSSFQDQLSLINSNQLKDGLQSKLTNSPQIQNDKKAMAQQNARFKNLRNKQYNWGNNINSFWQKRNEEVLNALSDEDRMQIAGEDGIIDYNEALKWQQSIGAGNDGKFGSNVGNIVNKKFGVNLGNFVNPANRTITKGNAKQSQTNTEQSYNNSTNHLTYNDIMKQDWARQSRTNPNSWVNEQGEIINPATYQGNKYQTFVTTGLNGIHNDLTYAYDPITGKIRALKEDILGRIGSGWTEAGNTETVNGGDWGDLAEMLEYYGIKLKKHGGHITKHQQGGAMNEQEQIIRQVIQGINQGDPQIMQALSSLDQQQQQAILQSIAQLAQQGDQEAINAINKIQNPQTAKLGTKLSYIKRLKGVCPEGTEKIYLKSGGCMCQKVAKAKEGTKADKNTIEQWKKDRKKYKNDEAAKDSVAINKYNDQETVVNRGNKGTYKNGVWVPDRSKYKNVEKKACGSKMKK